jgi:tight adherence protein C
VGTVNLDAAMAALFGAAAVAVFGLRAAHPPRAPGARISLYLEAPRAHLGGSGSREIGPLLPGEAARRVLGPLASRAFSVAARLVRALPPEEIEARLRQAGMAMTVEAYRREQLLWLLGTPLAMGAAGALTGHAAYVAVFFLGGLFAGARRLPERVRAETKRRNERLRAHLPAVAAALAMKIDSNKSLVVALSELVSQGSGPVVEDLGRAVHLMNAGYGEAGAFGLIAAEASEPAATRFYKFLAAATTGGLDLSKALLDQANELRAQRREEVERSAARRQMSLVVPNLLFMAPVLFIFLLAPLPLLLFGK